MKKPYRILTDYIDKRLGTINYVVVTRISKTFNYEHIKKCVDRFPQHKLKKMPPMGKAPYLFAICKKEAGIKDYTEYNNTSKLFDTADFNI